MTVERTPCEENPEQWFIGRDGKQYSDDDLTTEATLNAALDEQYPDGWEDLPAEEIDKVWDRLEAEAVRLNKIARRHAREACMPCPVRLRCLALGLQPENLEFGIWGGYFAEQRQEIDRLRRERLARRGRAGE